MDRRLQFHEVLVAIMDGSGKVYHQSPISMAMTYPCITYKRSSPETTFADNKPYLQRERYTVTVIHPDPDNEIRTKVADLPLSSHTAFFVADQLNHDVYNVYF